MRRRRRSPRSRRPPQRSSPRSPSSRRSGSPRKPRPGRTSPRRTRAPRPTVSSPRPGSTPRSSSRRRRLVHRRWSARPTPAARLRVLVPRHAGHSPVRSGGRPQEPHVRACGRPADRTRGSSAAGQRLADTPSRRAAHQPRLTLTCQRRGSLRGAPSCCSWTVPDILWRLASPGHAPRGVARARQTTRYACAPARCDARARPPPTARERRTRPTRGWRVAGAGLAVYGSRPDHTRER